MAEHILVVDDDPLVRRGLKLQFEQAGYRVVTAPDGSSALGELRLHNFDIAIVDIGLPDVDGLGLCARLRTEFRTPVILLTGRRLELDEIVGLEVGADDYITKPSSADLVLAHVRAVLRRPAVSRLAPEEELLDSPVRVGALELDPRSHRASLNGQELHLAPLEFDLLQIFLRSPDLVFTADSLIEKVWGAQFVGEPQVLYVQIHGLRTKIEPDPEAPRHLLTLRGVGYKFVP